MSLSSTPRHVQLSLADHDDETLCELARTWRRRASRGEREAFGIAHTLEREVRNRLGMRVTGSAELTPSTQRGRWWSVFFSPRNECRT